jgi:MoaA/NifB/PqqE/SkfB family radical SAM enzyme
MFDFVVKMNFFQDKINSALDGRVERSLSTVFIDLVSNQCNHNCIFCDGKFYEIEPKLFGRERLDRMASELEALGVDSAVIVGEGGESLLNPDFSFFAKRLSAAGIHLGLYTNGGIANEEIFQALADFDFVRVSLDAGCAATHQKVHGYEGRNDYDKVRDFIRKASSLKGPEVGASFIILRENVKEIYAAAKAAKAAGAGYLELKPAYLPDYGFRWNIFSESGLALSQELERCEALHDEKFKIVVNNQLQRYLEGETDAKDMTRLKESRPCLACKLRMVISPTGCYLCTPHRSKEEFRIGDPMEQSLLDIWNGPLHRSKMGNPCFYKCAYHDQNELLLQLQTENRSFEPVPVDAVAASSQKYFL